MCRIIFAIVCCLIVCPAARAALGIFEANQDVGVVLHPGSVEFDEAKKSYTIAGSGENMWAAKDAFQFVWEKASGDLALTADITFIGDSKEPHRKACLMIRQSLDADSPYVDVALHGDGMTSLQFRDARGAATHEVQANGKGPKRLRLEKRGKYALMYLAGDGSEVSFSGAATRIAFEEPFYVGLAVCAHNKDQVEKAIFSNVEIGPTAATRKPRLYSAIETQLLTSSDRRVTMVAPTRIESATWLDAQTLSYKSDGQSWQIPLAGGKSEAMKEDRKALAPTTPPDTGDGFTNFFAQPSPDGKRLILLSSENKIAGVPQDTDVVLRILNIETKRIDMLAKILGGSGTLDAPCWSPDGRRITFVTYQFIP